MHDSKKNKGIKKPDDFGEKISKARKGIKLSTETKNKMSVSMMGNKNGLGNKSNLGKIGELNPNWIKDRSKLIKSEYKHLDGLYRNWMKSVKNRDNWKCKIDNQDCKGRIEAHHILPWSKFPKLRYEINNGISLCQFHHPRKKNDVIKLVSFFKKLIQQ